MYQPAIFAEERLEVLHQLIRSHPFGMLASNGPAGPVVNALPFLVDPAASPNGTLLAHMARANTQWALLEENAAEPVVAIFQGAEAYITPSWYETKRQTGKVVPTWNYVMVQARGRARVIHDADWLRQQVEALTQKQESGRAQPWQVGDAPADFVKMQLRAIVGVEIVIDEIAGKWKVSQNRPQADREGVAEGLRAAGSTATEMGQLVRDRAQANDA